MNMKRMRGRNHRPGGGGGGGPSPIRHHNGQIPLNRNHVFDSNGPDLRIRGTAQQLFEKYLQLGRDATSSGDRVMAEGYFQHAEHYFRILNAIAQAAQQGQNQQGQNQPGQNQYGQNQGGQNQYGQNQYGQNQGGHANNQQRGRVGDEPDGDDRGEDPLISGSTPQPQERANQGGERQPRDYQNQEAQGRQTDGQNGERAFAERQTRSERQGSERQERHERPARQERFVPAEVPAMEGEPGPADPQPTQPVENQAAAARPERQAAEPRVRAPRAPRERAAATPASAPAGDDAGVSEGSQPDPELTTIGS